ncbi:MAG: tRNA dihydrouridine synthase DusB [Desulfuromonadales bacterium]|nr:tRNA dihydrouridine synthase DusB [Desulfuromonadales bacterium]
MQIGTLRLKNPIILAPMAGITDLPYRLVMKQHGAALVFTEMISANGLFFNGAATRELLRSVPAERPLAVQLFGDDPERLGRAAAEVEAVADLIDINLGCPVKKVIRCGAGSALLQQPRKIGQIVAAVRRTTSRPLTVKLRSGWDATSINYLEVARIAVAEGVDALTLHPRTRTQMFAGRSDWAQIADLKAAIKVPVIASGDIFQAEDTITLFDTTGCDAVMVARGGYGNPWLISQSLALLAGRQPVEPTVAERFAVASEHFDLCLETFGPRKTLGLMRKHLCWYTRGMAGAAVFRAAINQSDSLAAMRGLLESYFADAV